MKALKEDDEPELEQAEMAVLKRPAAKKATAKPLAKPKSKQAGQKVAVPSKPSAKAKPKAKAKRISGAEKAAFLATLPAKVFREWKDGCARCRYAPNCTYSCCKLRGW